MKQVDPNPEFDPQEAVNRMRELARDPVKKAEMEAGWNAVLDRLGPFYSAMRPKPKSFEVHHMNETARYRFATAIVANRPMADCVDLAVTRITG